MTRRQREAARRKRQAEDEALLRETAPVLFDCNSCRTVFPVLDDACPSCGLSPGDFPPWAD